MIFETIDAIFVRATRETISSAISFIFGRDFLTGGKNKEMFAKKISSLVRFDVLFVFTLQRSSFLGLYTLHTK